MEYLKMIEEMGNKFEFDYKNGNGHFSVNINAFFETVGSRDFKQFLDIVDLSSDPFQVVSDFQKIIVAKIESEKGYSMPNEKLINSLCGFLAQVEKKYGILCPEDERQEEKTKFKKCEVLSMIKNCESGKSEIHCFSGFKFSKFGYNFFVYKNPERKRGVYTVLLACCGLSIGYPAPTKEAAADIITRDIIDKFQKLRVENPEYFLRDQEFSLMFHKLAKESNFAHLFDADFCAIPDFLQDIRQEETAPESMTQETLSTPEECAQTAASVSVVKVEKTNKNKYNRIERFFSISKRTQRPYRHTYISIAHLPTQARKTPRNALKTARNDIVLCPCLLDFSKNGKWIMENADFSHTGLFTTVSPRFSVGYLTGKSPPRGYQKILPYFEF